MGRTPQPRCSRRRLWALVALFPVTFIAFATASTMLGGGDAWSGKAGFKGHYLGDHGRFVPVTPAAYWSLFALESAIPVAAIIAVAAGYRLGRQSKV